ncbi:hypothetical protein D1872_256730 [compost metagenome]
MPDAREQIGEQPGIFFGKKRDRIKPHVHQQVIDHAGLVAEQLVNNPPDDDPGNKMGDVQNGLRDFFEPDRSHFKQHDRQEDRRRKRYDQIEKIQHERVSQGHVKIRHGEDLAEGVKADPFAARDPLKQIKIFKSDLNAVHRPVAEYQKINDRQQQQRVQLPISLDIS